MATEHGTISTTPMTPGTGTTDGATDGLGDHGTAGMVAFGGGIVHTPGPIGDGDPAGAVPCIM
jgi:hypothetical protein